MYTPLHIHSNYSLLTGTITVDKITESVKKCGLKAAALTDYNGMYGLIKFAKKCFDEGIKPILGAVIDDPADKRLSAVLLARNNQGYSDLCKIITTRRLNDDFSIANIIKSKSENLFVLTNSIELLKELIPADNIYAELISTKKQKSNTRHLYEYCKANGFKYTASHPVYFENQEDFRLHKVVTAIRLNGSVENLKAEELADEEYFWKDPAEIEGIWKAFPEAVEANSYIAENCNVDLKLGGYKYPRFKLKGDEDSYSFLWKEAYKGLKENYIPLTQTAVDRLESELKVINELNLTDYFLIVWDIVREAKRRGMMLIGRGSAANSLVAYCLGLTQVDPIELNLYFQRFLNKGRSNPPDVDIDFSWKERDEIVKYVFDRYGYENVAMISTTVTFRARSAFREVAKAYGFTNEEISKYSKFIPWTTAANLPNVSKLFPEAKRLDFSSEPWKSIVDLASRLSDFPRHLSIHPSGIIITPGPVTDYTALEYAKNKGLGLIITQPDMYSIEDLGLIKIDLLSQRSLGVLRDTLDRIEKGADRRTEI